MLILKINITYLLRLVQVGEQWIKKQHIRLIVSQYWVYYVTIHISPQDG